MRLLLAAMLASPAAAQGPAASDPTAFALTLHKRAVAAGKKGENLMLSPYSARQAFGMAYLGAAGATRAEMAAALSAGPAFEKEELELRAALASEKDCVLRVANALWLKEGFPFLESFIARVKEAFAAEVFVRGFGPAALAELNAWAKKQTEGKIPKVLDKLDPLDRAVLLNAVYFKGKWRTAFPKTQASGGGPRPETFRPTVGDPFRTELMSVWDSFPYAEAAGWQAVRLPYRGGRLAMLVVLPARGSSLDSYRAGLDPAAWRALRAKLHRRKGTVALPRFKFSGNYGLKELLRGAGMNLAFDPGRADFTAMAKPEKRQDELYISRAIQKTFVAVDEEGTEAAAVTAVVMAARGAAMDPEEPFSFVADRPFLFAIEDVPTGTLLFLGEVHDPRR